MIRAMYTMSAPQTATAHICAGRTRARLSVEVTPAGLLAIGGLVAAILLSIPPIIRAASEVRRDR